MKRPTLTPRRLRLSRSSFAARGRVLLGAVLGLLVLPYLTGCDDDLFRIDWVENPDTVLLYSLARPELNLLSAFNFLKRTPVPIESPTATGQWDVVLDTKDGGLVLLPPGAVGVVGSTARVIPMEGMTFDQVREAPADTALYVGDAPVPVNMGSTYVIRTRRSRDFYGRLCVFYGKMAPIAMDPVLGTLTFVFDVSPECNSRRLYPT